MPGVERSYRRLSCLAFLPYVLILMHCTVTVRDSVQVPAVLHSVVPIEVENFVLEVIDLFRLHVHMVQDTLMLLVFRHCYGDEIWGVLKLVFVVLFF